MRASGNGAVGVCANNLLRLVRGEVPFERIKGIEPRIIDSPLISSEGELEADAVWLVETYEPRAVLESLTVKPGDGVSGGNFSIVANLKEKEE